MLFSSGFLCGSIEIVFLFPLQQQYKFVESKLEATMRRQSQLAAQLAALVLMRSELQQVHADQMRRVQELTAALEQGDG